MVPTSHAEAFSPGCLRRGNREHELTGAALLQHISHNAALTIKRKPHQIHLGSEVPLGTLFSVVCPALVQRRINKLCACSINLSFSAMFSSSLLASSFLKSVNLNSVNIECVHTSTCIIYVKLAGATENAPIHSGEQLVHCVPKPKEVQARHPCEPVYLVQDLWTKSCEHALQCRHKLGCRVLSVLTAPHRGPTLEHRLAPIAVEHL